MLQDNNLSDKYKDISVSNKIEYGTGIAERKNPTLIDLISKIYSDPTHFVYELLQNAEDAKASHIQFHLFKDRLEIIHNGTKLFNYDDVISICNIGKTTKSGLTNIGKFGFGFKSVYAYTDTPIIHSKDENFKIINLVLPHQISSETDLCDSLTKFILPFNRKEVHPNTAFQEISNKLRQLNVESIIFLRNIHKISWNIGGGLSGSCVKELSSFKGINMCSINILNKDAVLSKNDFLIFSKPTKLKKEVNMDIAFKVELRDLSINILPFINNKIFVYFPTSVESHIPFLVNIPFKTTQDREKIPFRDKDNIELVKDSEELLHEAFFNLLDSGILTPKSFEIFPIDNSVFPEEHLLRYYYFFFKDIILSGEDVLPSGANKYVSYKKAILFAPQLLRNLLNSEQIEQLFGIKDSIPLDSSITENKSPKLWKYLIQEIKVTEVTIDKFVNNFTELFIIKQTDEWLISFYKFLFAHESLWKNDWNNGGVILKKPFIRTENNHHIALNLDKINPNVFLPSEMKYNLNVYFVKKSLVQDLEVKKFFVTLGLTEPDNIDIVRKTIMPKYCVENISVSSEDNLEDIKFIEQTLSSKSKGDEIKQLIDDLSDKPILLTKTLNNEEYLSFSAPYNTYIGEPYYNNDNLNIYLKGNKNARFLDRVYHNHIKLDFFTNLGCSKEIRVKYKRPRGYDKYVMIRSYHGWHERGLDGFDPNFEIDELEYALQNIDLDRAKLLWEYLLFYFKSIWGIVESSTNQNYSCSRKEEIYSKAGKLFVSYPWLPHKGGGFKKMSKISPTELKEGFDICSPEARFIVEKFLKRDFDETILKGIDDPKKRMLTKELLLLTEEDKIRALELLKKDKEEQLREISCNASNKDEGLGFNNNEDETQTGAPFKGDFIKSGGKFIPPSSTPLEEFQKEYKDDFGNVKEHTAIRGIIHNQQNLPPDEEYLLAAKYRVEYTSANENIISQLGSNRKFSQKLDPVKKDQIIKGELKLYYKGKCQICNFNYVSKNGKYLCHKIFLLECWKGGWDVSGNAVYLCPNHAKIIKSCSCNINLDDIRGSEVPIQVYLSKSKNEELKLYYDPEHLVALKTFLRLK